jgi:NADH-ubiquinone oxidoreductase chain 1
MTEHAAVIFVFFFLAEYGSIVLICVLTTVLFLGGYSLNLTLLSLLSEFMYIENIYNMYETILSNPLLEGILYGFNLGFKSCIMIFTFI